MPRGKPRRQVSCADVVIVDVAVNSVLEAPVASELCTYALLVAAASELCLVRVASGDPHTCPSCRQSVQTWALL